MSDPYATTPAEVIAVLRHFLKQSAACELTLPIEDVQAVVDELDLQDAARASLSESVVRQAKKIRELEAAKHPMLAIGRREPAEEQQAPPKTSAEAWKLAMRAILGALDAETPEARMKILLDYANSIAHPGACDPGERP